MRSVVRDSHLVKLGRAPAGAALVRAALPRVVHEDLAHAARRDGEEVGATLELGPLTPHEPEIGFGDQICRTEGMALPFTSQMTGGQPPQLVVDQRRDLVECCEIAALPRAQELSEVLRSHIQ